MSNKLKLGDFVVHNTFPPVEGYISIIQPMVSGMNKIGVIQENETIFYDDECTWSKVTKTRIIDGYEVIDADYTEIMEDNK